MVFKMFVVNGHPDPQSFCAALTEAYMEGASKGGAEVRSVALGELDFNPNLSRGYRVRTELEPDLLQAQEAIRWADHLTFVYPTWWGAMPAVMKGFFDRTFLPGFAFRYRQDSALWDKLLTGKSGQLLVTTDTPAWYNRIVYGQAGHTVMRRNILGFCGVKPVRLAEFGPVKPSSAARREAWLEQARRLGERRARQGGGR
ncbi:NAD(P)H-dependent oxidoreductase [Paenibacillus sp. TRM 82003]|nr:NAD(P)H-dependent oxidoreductase [Paenibacillus sp. TRM 82003]